MSSIGGALGRMSARERSLVLGLVGVLSMLLLVGGIWVVNSKLADKERKISSNRKKWKSIQKLAGPYLASRAAYEATQERLKTNPDAESPDNPVAEVAVRTRVRHRTAGATEDESVPLNKLLLVTGDLKKKPLYTKKKGQIGPQVYRVDKDFEMKRAFVRSEDIFTFLSDVESMKNLVFVTELNISRWSRDPDFIQIKRLKASTLSYVESDGEE
jgi:hypothetical protein